MLNPEDLGLAPRAMPPAHGADRDLRYRAIFESAVDFAIIALDQNGFVTDWNPGAERILGWTAQEMRGAPADRFFTPEDRAEGRPGVEMRCALETGRASDERWHLRKDGSRFWASGEMHPLRGDDGTHLGFLKILRDRTEQRRAAVALRESEARFRATFDQAAVGVAHVALDGSWLRVNGRLCALLGYTEAELLEKRFQDITHPDDLGADLVNLRRLLDGAITTYSMEKRYLRKDGTPLWINLTVSLLRDETGAPQNFISIIEDISARKRAEAELRHSQVEAERQRRLYEAILTNTPDFAYVLDLDHRFTYANKILLEMWGRTREETIGRSWLELGYEPWHAAMHDREIDQVVATRQPVRGEVPFTGTFGRRIYDYIFVPVIGADGTVEAVAGTTRDVTERKQFEESLAANEARLRELLATLDLGALMTRGFDGLIRFWSAGCERLYGWTAEEAVGRSAHELLRTTFPIPLPEIEATLVRDGEWSGDLAQQRRDGTEIIVSARKALRRDADGQPSAIMENVIDVTVLRRTQAELRHLNERLEARVREEMAARAEAQAQLAHAQRMEALGQLAGGIAHDFNNVLQAVQGGAALIERRPEDPARVRRRARMIIEAAERGATITRRLLAFSRRGDLRAEPLDAADLFADVREILAHTLGAGIEIRVRTAPALPPLLADKGQLETVLVNLATNARDAMAGAGILTLAADAETLDDDSRPGQAVALKAGAYVRLSVSDTGTGMDAETLARAAEPFFTTKMPGQGTGLGLAMARGFAEQSGGGLLIESTPGHGTTVTVWFPVANGEAVSRPAPPDEAAVPAGPRVSRILLVDDEDLIRDVLTAQLADYGYAVLQAEGGAAALALLDAGEPVDLLVSDLSMPGMDGIALIREAQRRRPRLPAILLTGYVGEAAALAVGGAVGGAFSLLRKPVGSAELADRVATLLEAAATP